MPNLKREFENRFERLRGRRYGRVVFGPYERLIGTGIFPAIPGPFTSGKVWLADVALEGSERILRGVPIAGVNLENRYSWNNQVVALETIQGKLAITGRAEVDFEEGTLECYTEDGIFESTGALGTTCRQFTLGELGTIPVGGFGTTILQPTICTDRFGNTEVLQ